MKPDPIMAEMWKIKAAHAAKYGNDIRKMGAALMEQQKVHGDWLVDFSKKPRRKAA